MDEDLELVLEQPGGPVYAVDCQYPLNGGAVRVGKVAIMPHQLGQRSDRGQKTLIGQFFGIVWPGLILARHIFLGVERPLMANGNTAAGQDKLVYTWRPASDYVWKGSPGEGAPEKRQPPGDEVFMVLISPNTDEDRFPDIDGWIEHWTWVVESPILPEAPIDHEARFTKRNWSQA